MMHVTLTAIKEEKMKMLFLMGLSLFTAPTVFAQYADISVALNY